MKVLIRSIIFICAAVLGMVALCAQENIENITQEGQEGIGVSLSDSHRSSFSVSREIPSLLKGYWENSRRIIAFDNVFGDTATPQIVLKLFYGWYYDRAVESDSVSETQSRPRNDATGKESENLDVSFKPLIEENEISGAWNILISYNDFKETVVVPVAVFDDKLFVDYYLVKKENNVTLYEKASNASGITVNKPLLDKEVYSYMDTDSGVYKIRYWQTDMDYDGKTKAVLQEGENSYEVPKHLLIGDTVYTCVAGRRTEVRNIEKIASLPQFEYSSDNRIAVVKPAYVSRLDLEDATIFQHINEANSRKAPPPKPLLPPSDLDFHYDEIKELRKYMVPVPNFPQVPSFLPED